MKGLIKDPICTLYHRRMALHELDHTIHEGMYDNVHGDRIFNFVSLRCARLSLTGLYIHFSG